MDTLASRDAGVTVGHQGGTGHTKIGTQSYSAVLANRTNLLIDSTISVAEVAGG